MIYENPGQSISNSDTLSSSYSTIYNDVFTLTY